MKKLIFTLAAVLTLSSTANALEDGRYKQQLPDGSTDVIFKWGDLFTIEETRQVGGGGGISNNVIVRYPTICRVRSVGTIVDEKKTDTEHEVTFLLSSGHLADLEGVSKSEDCSTYIDVYNMIATKKSIRITIPLNGFTKVN